MTKDRLGDDIGVGDFILAGASHDSAGLQAYEIIGMTPKGYLKVKNGHYSWGRTLIQAPQSEAVKITKAQYEKLTKKS